MCERSRFSFVVVSRTHLRPRPFPRVPTLSFLFCPASFMCSKNLSSMLNSLLLFRVCKRDGSEVDVGRFIKES
jgi:hypothetical protein